LLRITPQPRPVSVTDASIERERPISKKPPEESLAEER
jgi:hypothetical protein